MTDIQDTETRRGDGREDAEQGKSQEEKDPQQQPNDSNAKGDRDAGFTCAICLDTKVGGCSWRHYGGTLEA